MTELRWECCSTAPGLLDGPVALAQLDAVRHPASVPGTAAGTARAAGAPVDGRDFDAEDWWYRTEFDVAKPSLVTLGGLATIADVWLDGAHVLHSENMFHAHVLEVTGGRHELVIRFAALNPVLAVRRPRPRWKVRRLTSQNLRWIRTSLLGRLVGWVPSPAPVGPWRPITIEPASERRILSRDVRCTGDGTVTVSIQLAEPPGSVSLLVGVHRAALTVVGATVHGELTYPEPERWWPHTHGGQPRYPLALEVDGQRIDLGRVGFRSIAAAEPFALQVNDVEVFSRGAYWTPLDPVALADDPTAVRSALTQFRDAGLNMVRIGGETVYPDDTFLDLCDELGLMVWQDCMFAFVDVPDDPEVNESTERELREQFARAQGHPCIAVVSGGSEIEQQAAMVGIPRAQWSNSLFTQTLPALVGELLPGIPFVSSSPSGGVLPIEPRTGIAHYYGVGAYLRDPDDARRAEVKFAAECLAFANPPERQSVDAGFGGASGAGHHPTWKAAVYRDAGAPWDFEDVRDHYVRRLFGVDPLHVRYADPERYLDLGRAAVAELFTSTLSEWRRPGSSCAGALVFHYRDLRLGAGLGIVDAAGRPKAPWYVMKRACAPVSVLLTDEGLNGVDAHIINDSGDPLAATLHVDLIARGEVLTEAASREVAVEAHSAISLGLDGIFDGFRDLSYAHRFGPPPFDAVVVSLSSTRGELLSRSFFLPEGPARSVEHDLGLTATASPESGRWRATVGSRRFAQWVSVDVPGFIASDSWFHLAPGETRTLTLTPDGAKDRPRGQVHALNCSQPTRLSLVDAP